MRGFKFKRRFKQLKDTMDASGSDEINRSHQVIAAAFPFHIVRPAHKIFMDFCD
jgi:hypothetical protein